MGESPFMLRLRPRVLRDFLCGVGGVSLPRLLDGRKLDQMRDSHESTRNYLKALFSWSNDGLGCRTQSVYTAELLISNMV